MPESILAPEKPTRLVLASGSPTRAALLRAAGISFSVLAPKVDERAVETPLVERGAPAGEIALALAEAKAASVASGDRAAYVVGADQTLECGGQRWHKPASRDEAFDQLIALSGRTHALHTAVAGAHGGQVVWRNLDTARLTMRKLSAAFINDYLDMIGEAAEGSVGAYQIEGPGIQLFEKIEGDHFTILGLTMLPLLRWLRGEGVIGT